MMHAPEYIQRLHEERDRLQQENERLKDDYNHACKLVARMHAAGMGEVCGPKRGVVEDIADKIADLTAKLEAAQKDRDEWKERTECYEDIEVQQAEWMKRNNITYDYDFTDGLSKVIDERDEQADRIRTLESLLPEVLAEALLAEAELSNIGRFSQHVLNITDRIRAALDAKKRAGR